MKVFQIIGKLVVFALALVCATSIAIVLYITIDGMTEHLVKTSVALVPGCNVHASGRPSNALKTRLNKAAELYHRGYFTTILVSGGIDDYHDESLIMRDYLIAQNVPLSAIVTDNSGVNSRASALFTANYLSTRDKQNVFLISQFFHITRLRRALTEAQVQVVGNAYARDIRLDYDIVSLFREVAGLIAYECGYK